MTVGEFSQLLTALAAFGAFVMSVWNSVRIKEVKHLTNSLKDELVAEVRVSERAAGRAEGVASEKVKQ